ncbi:lipocalin-like domain-containing protein [Vibrio superstes]|uniref:Carotenoid 1,2-hydratase n=1 Tax=Vibrio superstes NBRC 103154 TaxID=1219062 RepID=A0A511QP48_9VIBR|nr:lipocalin-like domain-containing protein [Vibrio superstes]GEM79108.1 carotenoid 1,2-hydratase [Vibrio superstes NBRC 103154]
MNLFSKLFLLTLLLTIVGCEEQKSDGLGNWLGESDTDYAKVLAGKAIEYPKDHGAHPDFRHEWWYLTANLIDENGDALGIQWTQFRVAIEPEATQQEDIASLEIWHSQQLYMAHSAVTTDEIHYADEKWSRDNPMLAGVDNDPFRVFLDDWQWRSSTTDMFPATLDVTSKGFSYSLTLNSAAPYQKQGEEGYSEKSADGSVASYYYSQPFISVQGEVTIDGKSHQVKGQGWIDREWSSQFLLDSQQGWDWFALRLDAKTSLVVFQLRDSKSGDASYSHARLMYSNGESTTLTESEISLTATEQTSIEGRPYPTKWQLKIPSQQIDLNILALNPNAKMPLTIPYWEGPVTITGSHSGNGYMELTGY